VPIPYLVTVKLLVHEEIIFFKNSVKKIKHRSIRYIAMWYWLVSDWYFVSFVPKKHFSCPVSNAFWKICCLF